MRKERRMKKDENGENKKLEKRGKKIIKGREGKGRSGPDWVSQREEGGRECVRFYRG